MSLSRENREAARRAARAVAQWELGDPTWGDLFVDVLLAEDPLAQAREVLEDSEFMDDATLKELL